MVVISGSDLSDRFKKFDLNLRHLSFEFKGYESKAKLCANEIKCIKSVDFLGFGASDLRSFISDVAASKRKFKRQVEEEGVYNRTFLCFLPYKAGIKKTIDQAFANLDQIQKQAEAAEKAICVANEQFQPKESVSYEQRRAPSPPAPIFRTQSDPVRRVPRDSNSQLGTSRLNSVRGGLVQDLSPRQEAKINQIATRCKTTFDEAKRLIDFIDQHRDRLKREAIQKKQGRAMTRKESGLVRSLQFDADGKVWIFLNQVTRKQDAIVGTGGFKRVTDALDFDTMAVYVRPVMKATVQNQAIADREIECLRSFGQNTPGIVETLSITSYRGKGGILKSASIQFKYENNLRTELSTKNPTLEMRLSIATDLAQGLIAIHKKGYIHTDLKPGNVLLRTIDPNKKKAVISDFGLAWRKGEKIHSVHGTAGTQSQEGYIAPEYLHAGKTGDYGRISNKIDIWSMGRVFEELFPNAIRTQGLQTLIASMKDPNPKNRPAAKQILTQLQTEIRRNERVY